MHAEKILKIYNNENVVKDSQIKEFEKFGIISYAEEIKREGPIMGGLKVFGLNYKHITSKCFCCGLDYKQSMAIAMLAYRNMAKNNKERLHAVRQALRIRKALCLNGLRIYS